MYKTYKNSNNFSLIKENPSNEINCDLDLYLSILEIQSPSYKEINMINFIKCYIRLNHPGVLIETDNMGNLYITKGKISKDEYYPCLVAHTDEVHSHDEDRKVFKLGDFFIGWNMKTGEKEGIGCDDKNGIFIALTLLEHFDKLKLFFPVQEEVGLRGSSKCDITWFNNVGYLIQADRRGYKDLISTTNGVDVSSLDFLIEIEDIMNNYEYSENVGTCTDIGELLIRGVNVSACNVSCGYWDEHTDDELTHIPSMINCLNFIYKIIKKCKYRKFEFVCSPIYSKYDYGYNYNYKNDWYDDFDEYDEQIGNLKNTVNDEYPCNSCEDGNCVSCKKFDEWIGQNDKN